MAVENNIEVTQEEIDAVEPVDVEITDEDAVEQEQVQEQEEDFYANLAENMDERVLNGIKNGGNK